MSRNNLKVFNIQYVIPHTQELFTVKVLGTDFQKAEVSLRSLIFKQLKARGVNANYNTCIEVTNRSAYCDVDLVANDMYEYFKSDSMVDL